jgi:hypothetical protein
LDETKRNFTDLSEDGKVFHHELGGRFHRVQLQEVNLRLLAQLAD